MLLEFQLELIKLNKNRQIRVATAVKKLEQHLFSGSHIVTVHPYGSSGGYTLLFLIEDRLKDNMNASLFSLVLYFI
ncbi:unnamed protein product [Rotaria sp. Silwood1]|nr:unnamed protein product [Rotaria sp. Silwood1]CAF4895475.1 unnamed protein product [Rotaria sp. Silwood1]